MIQIAMTDRDMLLFFSAGEWHLGGGEPGFDRFEQEPGKIQVEINGDLASVWIHYRDPACGCCSGDRIAGAWWITLAA